ncbi:MAG: diguanylate cyclase [Clostridiales bacterium]|nr:diguanylate cyclase [Clostridiales bacterium]
MRVAFASIDGTWVDQHFGSARYFQIFDLKEETYEFVEARRTESYCRGNCEGGFEHLLKALDDCDAIFVVKIGQGAAAFMINHGKRVFEAYGPVRVILDRLLNGDLMEGR